MTKTVTVNGVQWNSLLLQNLIKENDSAVIRGLLKIYEYQTMEEKNSLATIHNNGVGFSGVHGNIMSSFAEFYKKSGFLTPKQIAVARKIMLHYVNQLLTIMEGKQ